MIDPARRVAERRAVHRRLKVRSGFVKAIGGVVKAIHQLIRHVQPTANRRGRIVRLT
jgi:hypothetical protein